MNELDKTRSIFLPTTPSPSMSKTKNMKRNDDKRSDEINITTKQDARVDISEGMKDFAKIKKAVDSAPEQNNQKKIDSLKQKISKGDYKIDYDKVADKMIQDEFMLSSEQSGKV